MISTNAEEILRRMRARSGAVTGELAGAARSLALALGRESKLILQRGVYDVPIPRRPRSGKPKWRRTANLKRREAARAAGTAVLLENKANYAGARHALGTAAGRQIVSPGIQSVQWQAEAVARKRTEILQTRRQAVLRALRRR